MSEARRRLRRLRRHRVPAWWRDAKLGIMVHWTPASVPAFAPVAETIGDLLRSDAPDALSRVPYAEWYENSLRFPASPVARHHRETYGDRPYAAFAGDWEAGLEGWDPDDWARRFAATGAGHVVFVAKHADGYSLWPTAVGHPRRDRWHCRRDVVGEMAEAVRGAGMRFGLYYCGGFDWSFEDRPIGTMADVLAAVPRGDYPAYADAQVRELAARYRPSVLWNDVAWPGRADALWSLFEDYYAQVPDGLVNDRWLPWSGLLGLATREPLRRLVDAGARRRAERAGGLVPPAPPHFDVRTPEYARLADPRGSAWECVRGMDHGFGHNASSRPGDFLSRAELLWLLADVVADGGNLLLNVGPRGVDATIPDEQRARLDWLTTWMGTTRGAIQGTRPWVASAAAGDDPVRYTARDDVVHAFVREPGPGPVTLAAVAPTATTAVRALDGTPLTWHGTSSGVVVDAGRDTSGPPRDPLVLECRGVVARSDRAAG